MLFRMRKSRSRRMIGWVSSMFGKFRHWMRRVR